MITRKNSGLGLIAFTATALVIYLLIQPQIIQLLETFVSSDGEIRPDGGRQLSYLVFLLLSRQHIATPEPPSTENPDRP